LDGTGLKSLGHTGSEESARVASGVMLCRFQGTPIFLVEDTLQAKATCFQGSSHVLHHVRDTSFDHRFKKLPLKNSTTKRMEKHAEMIRNAQATKAERKAL